MDVRRQALRNYSDAIMEREVTSKGVDKILFQKNMRGLRFKRPYITEKYDTNAMFPDPEEHIHQILATEDFLFFVREELCCMVFSKESDRIIYMLEQPVTEVVYNEHQLSIILVLAWEDLDGTSNFSFISSPIRCFHEGNPMDGQHLFQSETSIVFYSFDVKNCKGMIYSGGEELTYKFFDLRTYEILYTIPHPSGQYVEIGFPINLCSHGSLMVMCDAFKCPIDGEIRRILPLHIFNKDNGDTVMVKRVEFMDRRALIDSITLCGDKILIQPYLQYGGLRIVDLKSDEFVEPHDTRISLGNPPLYLHERHCFMGDLKNYENQTPIIIGIWDLNNKLFGTSAHNGSPDWRIEIPSIGFPPPQWAVLHLISLMENGYMLFLFEALDTGARALYIVDVDSRRIMGRIEVDVDYLFCAYYDEYTHDILGGDLLGHVIRWRF